MSHARGRLTRRALLAGLASVGLASGASAGRPTSVAEPVRQARAPVTTPESLADRARAAIRHGVEYLRRQREAHPQVLLLREAPEVCPERHWLYGDNALAAQVLDLLGEADLSAALWSAVEEYERLPGYQNPRKGHRGNGLVEILWGEEVAWPPRTPRCLRLVESRWEPMAWGEVCPERPDRPEVCVELADGDGVFQDWEEYTNLAMLGALDQRRRGNHGAASVVCGRAMEAFDGTGFRDKAFWHRFNNSPSPITLREASYETFKAALALHAGLLIGGLPGSTAGSLVEAMLRQQRSDSDALGSGGFYTHYRADGATCSDTNTETTALVLLALHTYLTDLAMLRSYVPLVAAGQALGGPLDLTLCPQAANTW